VLRNYQWPHNVALLQQARDTGCKTGLATMSPLGPLRADIAEALLKADFDETELFRFGASTNF
jgi:outer membrane protein insertion porin family